MLRVRRVEPIPWGQRGRQIARVHWTVANAPARIATSLRTVIRPCLSDGRHLLFLCIGSDRSTGDAFGPLVGSFLIEGGLLPCSVRGTLEEPVHAGNLSATVADIHQVWSNPIIIAVDACLGRPESVGQLQLCHGSIKPGSGVQKELTPVGDAYLAAVVNEAGYWGEFHLHQTRLSLVMQMAQVAAAGIRLGLQLLQAEEPYAPITDLLYRERARPQ
jgi:putative sporulation protein YyaC